DDLHRAQAAGPELGPVVGPVNTPALHRHPGGSADRLDKVEAVGGGHLSGANQRAHGWSPAVIVLTGRGERHDVTPTRPCHSSPRLCRLSMEESQARVERVSVVRVFVAGGTGVLGRRLVPQLVARGHQVTATTTSRAKLDLLRQLGADGVVMDGLDAASVGAAVAAAQPDTIVHQMTAINAVHAGKPDFRHFDRWFATTSRLRTEGTDHLLAAAEATGVANFVAQGYANWNGLRQGGWVKTEEDPLDPLTGTAAQAPMAAIRHVEEVVLAAGGAVLRYGG